MPTLKTSIIRLESLGSTNTEAASWAMQGAPEGLCIVANEQTAGRGRFERRWVSPKGAGLYFSIVLRPRLQPGYLPLITLMASLAVHDALRETCALVTDIKWPNDVLVQDRKLSGILAEVIDTTVGQAVVLGIGINVNKDSFPPELSGTATSVESVTGGPCEIECLLQSLIAALETRYQVLQSAGGEAATIRDWSALSSFAEGKDVRITNGAELMEGITRGLEPDGALRIETASGETRVVRAGDVTVRPYRGSAGAD